MRYTPFAHPHALPARVLYSAPCVFVRNSPTPRPPSTHHLTPAVYATHEAQPWHNDVSDLVSLLCLQPAKSGGHSSWSSSVSIHNEIIKRAPHLAKILADPIWFYDRKGEVPAGKEPYFLIPVFNYHKGHLFVNFSSNYYYLSQRHPEVPRLTPEQLEAIEVGLGRARTG